MRIAPPAVNHRSVAASEYLISTTKTRGPLATTVFVLALVTYTHLRANNSKKHWDNCVEEI